MLNEIVGTAVRFQQLLTRKFGLIGGAPAPQLTPEIQPIFEIEGGPEARILASETLSAVFGTGSAAAAKASYMALSNPVDSGIVAAVEQIWLYAVTGQNIIIGWATSTPPAPNQTSRQRDGRKTGVPTCKGRSGSDQATDFPTVATITQVVCPTGSPQQIDADFILAPGNTLVCYSSQVNVEIRVSILWREVPLARGEAGPF